MKPETKKYLERVNAENHGLIDTAHEWIANGWEVEPGLATDPTPEMIAAVLLMEAKTQDECVKDGDSCASFPILLREIGTSIIDMEHPCQHIAAPISKDRIFALLPRALQATGSFDPNESLSYIEEDLTAEELNACEAFLHWLIANKRTFGHNLPEVWAEWQKEISA